MPRTVFPPSAIITAVSVSTRPRSWPGVNPSRCSTRDRAVVRPVRSAVSRNAAAPACAVTASPPAVTVKPLDHPVESFTRKVPLDMGLIWTSQPGFSQIEGTFHYPHTTLSQQDRETLRHGGELVQGPAAAELCGVVRDGLEAQHAFALPDTRPPGKGGS